MVLPLCIVVMGVSGSGKSTVGAALAKELSCPFYDADDFHPTENIAKMKSGRPLTDSDRLPWLRSLNTVLKGQADRASRAVLACSALKTTYRAELRRSLTEHEVGFVHLQPSRDELERRLELRASAEGHFMPPSLLTSQLDTLEVDPDDAIITITSPRDQRGEEGRGYPSPEEIVRQITELDRPA